MAAETLSSVSNALSLTFAPDLARQWNRSAITAGLVNAVRGTSAGGGKSVNFDVEFSGATATTVAEGSDVSGGEYASDVNVPATFAWAHYRSSFQVSETELDAAASSVGVANALMDLFGERILGGGAKIARAINADMINGTGVDGSSNPTITGFLGGALDASGTYGGLSRSTYPEWNGNVITSAGTLTVDLLEQMDQNIFTASNEDWTHLLVAADVYRKYRGLFETIRRIPGDGAQPSPMGLGAASDVYYKGRPVLRDPSIGSGKAIFFNASRAKVKWLPRALSMANDSVSAQLAQLEGGNGNDKRDVTGIPVRIALLGKTGDNIKCSMKVTLAMCVCRPNSMGYITGIV